MLLLCVNVLVSDEEVPCANLLSPHNVSASLSGNTWLNFAPEFRGSAQVLNYHNVCVCSTDSVSTPELRLARLYLLHRHYLEATPCPPHPLLMILTCSLL